MTEHARWVPREGLVADLRHAIARAPRDTAEDRFEAWAWRAMLDEHGAALLTRHAAPSHVTASAAVLSPDGLLTCLVLHRRLGLWVQPGGHLEADDMTLPLAAAREVEEETGWRCRLGDHVGKNEYRDRHGRSKRVDWWLMEPLDGTFAPNDEVDEIRWVPVAQARELLTHADDYALVEAAGLAP